LVQVEYLWYELREVILLKACRLMLSSHAKVDIPSYVDIYVTLASVCDRFYEVVRQKLFRRHIKQYVKGLFLYPSFWFITNVCVEECKCPHTNANVSTGIYNLNAEYRISADIAAYLYCTP